MKDEEKLEGQAISAQMFFDNYLRVKYEKELAAAEERDHVVYRIAFLEMIRRHEAGEYVDNDEVLRWSEEQYEKIQRGELKLVDLLADITSTEGGTGE